MTESSTAQAPAQLAAPSPDEQIGLAVAIFNAICTRAAAGNYIKHPNDLLADLSEEAQKLPNLTTFLAVLVRALASGEFITEKDPIGPTAFGITVHAQGDAPLQIMAKDVIGWRSIVAAAQLALELSQLDNQRKDDEIAAYKKRVRIEKELAGEVTACEADVEAAKAEVSAAKERLASANTKLAAFVRGDVQTSIAEGKQEEIADGQVTAYEQGLKAFDPEKAQAINPYRDDPQKADWQRGYEWGQKQHQLKQPAAPFPGAEKAAIKSAEELGIGIEYLDDHFLGDVEQGEARRGTSIQVESNTVRAFERDYLVIDGTEAAPYRYLVLPLYTKDEWQQLHEATYGRAVEGIDQTNEAKVQRQAGGEFCGRAVKFGRKKMIIGPLSDALVIEAKDEPAETTGDAD